VRGQKEHGGPETDYDDFAEAYSADNEVNLLNGHYERPEMLRLAGDEPWRELLRRHGVLLRCRASGRTVVYTSWHRPLQPMGDEFTAAGFRISVISEPDPAGRTRPTAR
jgi:hypothetical protein